MKDFVHLHVHTQYSLLDGATRIEQIFSRAYDMGMKAVAITDHGNMYGALEFVKAAVRFTDPKADPFDFLAQGREFKVKPIIGCELYMCDDRLRKETVNGEAPKLNHLILLAKNEIGYKNLIKLVSIGYIDGFYHKPRIDFSCLEGHTEGLVCLSACIAGVIPQALLRGDEDGAQRLAEKFKSLFGEDFYIEIQDHNIRDQKTVLPRLVRLARNNGIKIVATNDVHYLKKRDAVVQKMLQCISFQNTMVYEEPSDEDEPTSLAGEGVSDDGYFPTKEFYMKSGDEMAALFPSYPDSIENTVEVADKCRCDFFRKEPLMPPYVPDDGSTPTEYLRRLTYEGLQSKYGEITDEIKKRAEYELGIVEKLGFVEYFLIVWDFIHWAESQGIPVGPGRGSGVGSIVAYAIGITKVNPLKYALIFERFLNPARVSNPDFDIDFCVDRREEVIEYVTRKYGAENVSQIVTFGTLKAKAAVKDVGRVYSHPFSETQKLTKPIPNIMGKLHLEHLLGLKTDKDGNDVSNPDLKEMYGHDLMAKRILDMAMQIEGMPRQTGMHAAGVIICRDVLSDHVPMTRTKDGIITTQFNMVECEELGLLKMDFLGLRTLTDIKKAIDLVKQTKGIEIDFYGKDGGYDDPGVFELISSGDTHAVFQLESAGMKKFMRDLKPTSLEDIIAGISLYRPGPMQYIDTYVANKRNPAGIKYDHPLLEPILSVTYGIMVYQEQVMQMVQELAGYSMGNADNVRRMMSKKKLDAMNKEREIFLHGGLDNKGNPVDGCIKRGVSEAVGNKIFDDMMHFASYAFNKSHAAAYAYLAYQTAYLKRYHTVEFVTAVLNNRITSIDEIRNYLTYLREKDIAVLPPDINKSHGYFTVENGAVRIGMAAIKNVGMPIIEAIVSERNRGGEFKDFVEFVNRMSMVTLNKKMLESLIYAGTFDCFGHARSQLIGVFEQVLDRASHDRKVKLSGQLSMFDGLGETTRELNAFSYPNIREYTLAEKLAKEKEVASIYLTGHPLQEYSHILKDYEYNTTMFSVSDDDDEAMSEMDGKTVTIGGMLVEAGKKFSKDNKEIGIGKLEDLYGTVDLAVSGFKLAQLRDVWVKDKLVTVTGRLRVSELGASIWVDKVQEWNAKAQTVRRRKICLYYSFKENPPSLLDSIQDVLAIYPGEDETYVKNTDDNKLYPLEIGVECCKPLLAELSGLLGGDNIKVAES